MKLRTHISLLSLLIVFFVSDSIAQRSPLTLWYRQPADKWTEALPVGNGRIGAMIFGGINEDRIQFNEETLWTGEPRRYSRPGAYLYLDSIRKLLFAGNEAQAEALAEKEFMGLKSDDGKKDEWVDKTISLKGIGENPALAAFDDSQWPLMRVPSFNGWEVVGHEGLGGAVWLRTGFDLPPDWTGKDLILDLNRIRDRDLTYFNGKMVGTRADTEPRQYRIPKELLKPGRNVIAVQVLNFSDKGGICGYKDTTKHIGVFPAGSESEKISLNGYWKYFIQDDEPPAIGTYQAAYQPFGDLYLKFNDTGRVSGYERSLDIATAICRTGYTLDGVDYSREYFVSQPNQLMVVHLAASKRGKISFEAALSSPHKNSSCREINDSTILLSVKVRNGVLLGESRAMIRCKGGKLTTANGKFFVTNADEVTLYLGAGTSYRNYMDTGNDPALPCISALESIAGRNYAEIRETHIREYKRYFETFSIDLGKSSNEQLPTDQRLAQFADSNDPAMVALYLQYGRYLLISSSRPGTRPSNLQGIWNDLLAPPWGSKYTTNINLEMNYWPSEILHLGPMNEPLFGMIQELAVTGHQTAADHYNSPGWVLHHNTDLWRGTAPINAANHGIWVTGGAWLCEHLWEHYLFTQDRDFLRKKAYPIMKEAAIFFQSFLIKDPATGWLISTPSNSPEQGGLVAGPAMDHQIIRSLYSNVISAARILGVDRPWAAVLQDQLKQIAPDRIGRFGQLQEWMKDVDDTTNKHRHISHLWGMFPGRQINWDETPALMKAARQSLIYRGDAATGWSLGWKINCWARFRDGDHAFSLIRMLISPAKGGAGSYPNLFDAHPPFQIDGNFGGAAGIAEMLVQSHTKYLDILPALPRAMPAGSITGLCARGGFVIDMRWENNILKRLTIHSNAGQPLILRYRERVIQLSTTKNGIYKFDGLLQRI